MAAAACVCRTTGSAGATLMRRLMAAAPTGAVAAQELAVYPPGGEELSFSSFGRAAQLDPRAVGAGGSWAGMAAAAAPELPGHPFGCRPNLLVVLTSHKTGTAQAR